MDIELMKWYKAPVGGIYRINYAIKHPLNEKFFIQVEKIPCIWDYAKRSITTRYEIKESFYTFYIDQEEKTEQQLMNSAYITAMLLGESVAHIEAELSITIDNKRIEELNIQKNKIRDDFQFKTTEMTYREAVMDELRDTLDIDIINALQVVSPY